jgi:lysophospholipase L1-like esterase
MGFRKRSWAGLAALVVIGALAACGADEAPAVLGPDDAGDEGRADAIVDAPSGLDGATADAARDAPGEADAAPDASLLAPGFVYRDINHVLGTGQSLSVGSQGTPTLSTTQPYDNQMFVTGVIAGGAGLTSFVPLVEGARETLSSAFASSITKLARDVLLVGQPVGQTSHDLLVSAHGVGGRPYSALKKNGTLTAYANGIAQAQAAHDLAVAAGKTHVVRAVTNVHGESDHNAQNAAYEADLLEWQRDYETDVRAITGQAEPVPMLHTQFSSWTKLSGGLATSAVAAAQLSAHVFAPGKIILVGAKYHLPYAADGVHLTNDGYRHMGEDYAKVYRRVILEGKVWEPVRPKAVTRVGATVTLTMFVPAPPLVLDTQRVTDPGSYGFEWTDDGPDVPTITSVAVTAADTVTIKLSAPPNANGRIRYAFTGISGAGGGPTSGPRGNLRDSDASPSRHGYELYNWAVHFDVATP